MTHRVTTALICQCLGLASLHALNDANAVAGLGLIPLGERSVEIVLVREDVLLSVLGDGVYERRHYELRSEIEGTFDFAVVLAVDDFWVADATRVLVDRSLVDLQPIDGRLTDRGYGNDQPPAIVPERVDPGTLLDCRSHNDGDICGHRFAVLQVEMGPRRAREITLEYRRSLNRDRFSDNLLTPWGTDTYWRIGSEGALQYRARVQGWIPEAEELGRSPLLADLSASRQVRESEVLLRIPGPLLPRALSEHRERHPHAQDPLGITALETPCHAFRAATNADVGCN